MIWRRLIIVGLMHLAMLVIVLPTVAQETDDGAEDTGSVDCPDADGLGASLVNNICWDCIFPIRIAGADISLGDSFVPAAPPGRQSVSAAIASASRSACGSLRAWSNWCENPPARRP